MELCERGRSFKSAYYACFLFPSALVAPAVVSGEGLGSGYKAHMKIRVHAYDKDVSHKHLVAIDCLVPDKLVSLPDVLFRCYIPLLGCMAAFRTRLRLV